MTAGTYDLGLVAYDSSGQGFWDHNDYAGTSVIVGQPSGGGGPTAPTTPRRGLRLP
jgi:hypothetical protein